MTLVRNPLWKDWWDAVDEAAERAPARPGHCPVCDRLRSENADLKSALAELEQMNRGES